MSKKILFIIPDGIGIRNYLYSDLFSCLIKQGFHIHLLHRLEEEVIDFVVKEKGIPLTAEPLRILKESRFQQFLRETSTYARLKLNAKNKNNKTILSSWFKVKNNPLKRAFQRVEELASVSVSSYAGIQYLEETNRFKWKKNPAIRGIKSDLLRINPDLVFITHQRVPALEPWCLAAKELDIKTVTAIFSWDNLPKARLPIRTDHYVVWSDYMKSEMQDYYPEIARGNIHVAGTPQFDFHFKKDSLQSRDDFAKDYGLDLNKKWILFSGDDEITSPHDPHYLEDVANALASNPDISLLFRQVPITSVDRYQSVIDKHPNIVHVPPKWKKGTHWMSFYPLMDDVKLLMNLCHHCEFSVNIGSTIGLDFTYFDKPTVFLAYDTVVDKDWSTERIYKYQHFRTFENLDAVVFAREKASLEKLLKQVLERPQDFAKQKHEWRQKIASNTSDNLSSLQLTKLLCSLADKKNFVS